MSDKIVYKNGEYELAWPDSHVELAAQFRALLGFAFPRMNITTEQWQTAVRLVKEQMVKESGGALRLENQE